METKDPALKIMLQLDDRELFIFCGKKDSLEFKNSRFSRYCNDKYFWEKRFTNRFGKIAASYKPKDRSWKMHYLIVVSQLDVYSNDPWSFFDLIKWSIDEKPEEAGFYVDSLPEEADVKTSQGYKKFVKVDKAEESLHNTFWMLELGKEIVISYPIFTYRGKDYEEKFYKSDTQYTPGKVLQLIYDFYEEASDYINSEDEDVSEEDDVKRIDFMGAHTTLEGFTDEDGIKILSLGS